jgi:hypothetical protein
MKEESRIEALEHELKILKNEIQSTLLEIREQILNHYYPELRAEEPMHSHSLPVRPQVGRPQVPAKATPRSQPEASIPSASELEAKGQIQPFSDIFLEDLASDNEDDDEAHDLINSRRPSALKDDDDGEEYDESEDEDLQGDDDQVVKVQTLSATHRGNFGVTPQTREVDFRQLKQASSNGVSSAAAPRVKEVPAPESAAKRSETPAPKATRPTFAALASWVSNGVSTVGKERTTQVVETYALRRDQSLALTANWIDRG